LTRSITIITLTCFLVVGAAATSILSRESMQASDAETPAMVVKNPIANRESKHDRLVVTSMALASMEPQQKPETANESLRQAYAASSAADIEAAKAAAALPQVAAPAAAAPSKPKAVAVAAKPQPPAQKSYALLSDGQIAGIKERLKLSSSQESYWPAVETALRAVAHKIHTTRQGNAANGSAPQIDPDSDEVQQLKSAAMPLLFQLREDQKEEVRKLARIIGLDKVASAI
jgi:hypothetical protein